MTVPPIRMDRVPIIFMGLMIPLSKALKKLMAVVLDIS